MNAATNAEVNAVANVIKTDIREYSPTAAADILAEIKGS